MKKYFIPLSIVVLVSCSSGAEKKETNTSSNENAVVSDGMEMADIKDATFRNYLSNFKAHTVPLILTLDSVVNFGTIGASKLDPDPNLKKLSLDEISKYISKAEAEEKSKLKHQSHLEFYYSYLLKNSNKNIVSCLVFKDYIDVVNCYFLLNYDLNGNLIDKLQVSALYRDDKLQAEVEKSCVIKDAENIIVETKIPVNDVTIITETYKVDENGKFILSDKKEEKKPL